MPDQTNNSNNEHCKPNWTKSRLTQLSHSYWNKPSQTNQNRCEELPVQDVCRHNHHLRPCLSVGAEGWHELEKIFRDFECELLAILHTPSSQPKVGDDVLRAYKKHVRIRLQPQCTLKPAQRPGLYHFTISPFESWSNKRRVYVRFITEENMARYERPAPETNLVITRRCFVGV